MKLRKLPLLGVPVALANFFATTGAIAKDLDPQTLAKMNEASAVRVACGIGMVDDLTPAFENGSLFLGMALGALIALGAAVLLRKRGVPLKPIVAWAIPLLVTVPSIAFPQTMMSMLSLPLSIIGFREAGVIGAILLFIACAIMLVWKVFALVARIVNVLRYRAAVVLTQGSATRKPTVQGKPSCRTSMASRRDIKYDFKADIGAEFESARSNFERTYESSPHGARTLNESPLAAREADDTACLSR